MSAISNSSYLTSDHSTQVVQLPSKKEWNEYTVYQMELIKTSSHLTQLTKENLPQTFEKLYLGLMDNQGKRGFHKFHQKYFRDFYAMVASSEVGFFKERGLMVPQKSGIVSSVAEKQQLFAQSSEQLYNYRKKISPYLTTLHKVTAVYLQNLEKAGVISPISDKGIVYDPQIKEAAVAYLRNEGLFYPYANVEPKSSEISAHSLPIYSEFNLTAPLQRAMVLGKGHVIRPEGGCLIEVGDSGVVSLIYVSGQHPTIPFAKFPFNYVGIFDYAEHRFSILMSDLIPKEKRFPGYVEFFPFAADSREEKHLDLALLEEVIQSSQDLTLIEEVKKEIVIIESELIEDYVSDYELQIQKEQEERKRLVITGEINEPIKVKKAKLMAKAKQIQKATNNNSSSSNLVAETPQISIKKDAAELLKQAKVKLEVEKKRIKKHKLLNFISKVKKILKQSEFESLVTQEGSHLHIHSEEKEPLTLVVPHKGDRTTSGKLLNRFINRLEGIFKAK